MFRKEVVKLNQLPRTGMSREEAVEEREVVKEKEVEKGTTHLGGLCGAGILGMHGALEMIDRGLMTMVSGTPTIEIAADGKYTRKLLRAGMSSFQ